MPRPRKGAHIYRRRGRPGWWAYIDRDTRHVPLDTEDEAEAQVRLGALLDARRLQAAPKSTHPLASIFDACHERAVTAHTRKTAYEVGLNLDRILAWCTARGVTDCEQVTPAIVEDYKTARHRFAVVEKPADNGGRKPRAVSAARVNRELDTWKKAMKIAVEQGSAKPDILEAFAHIREPRPEPHRRGLGRRDLDRFFRAVTDPPLRAFFRLTLGTAMRDEEVRHLSADDVSRSAIRVQPKPPGFCACCPKGWSSKSYRHRTIPASAATVAAARTVLKARTKGWAIPDPKRVWIEIGEACARAKLPRFSLHDLRRAGASHWLLAGVKLAHISAWLGHADLLTTMRYLRIVDESAVNPRDLPW